MPDDERREEENNGGGLTELPIFTTKRMLQTGAAVLVLLVAIYFLFPKLVGLGDAVGRLGEAEPIWIAVAIAFSVASYATYIALFKSVVGGEDLRLTWGETYQINMAGVAATLLFSAGGAGGVALTYWALRKAGMRRREVARRMIAFVSLHYAFYPLALIVFGLLLRTGVVHGEDSVELTVVPAAIAGLMLALGALITLIPADVEGKLMPHVHGEHTRSFVEWASGVPETLGEGFRFALRLFTHPRRGGLAVLGAAGFWATSIGVLWASFHALGIHVPLAVVVQGFFLGMVANLFPLAPAGVGAVDAGMIGAFVLFGLPEETVFPAILIFRLVSFWMPIPPGVVAFFQLRNTVRRWEADGLPIERGTELRPAAAGSTLQKVK
ncbi:MAG TPA: lysylphosphatidylglycerol synthase transmembrane domain-containing protein [Solirubrobacterales bacterium]|nr:lysylphosphatidylglycerol synthase transmembrane domain-containing protein [Solirubrobacterales bacterium]